MERLRVTLGGAPVDLMSKASAVQTIMESAMGRRPRIAVASANLDHIFHFGAGGRWHGVLDESRGLEWLTLLDGSPLVGQARRLTRRSWPLLAGSDLILDLLEDAQELGTVVGFLGGSARSHQMLQDELAERWPKLVVGGCWTPDRAELVDPTRARALADQVCSLGVQLLFVGLGKPRQEVWIAEHGAASGAGALLAFGAAADFVSGSARRAPSAVRFVRMEWLWRLVHDPKRLAKRYLVEGPGAYLELRRRSSLSPAGGLGDPTRIMASEQGGERSTVDTQDPVADEVTVIIVTFNSAGQVGALLGDLDRQLSAPKLRVVVVDNCSTDSTRAAVRAARSAELVEAESNLGYAGAINLGVRHARPTGAVLVLNPDLRLEPDAVAALWCRMRAEQAGAVVPLLIDEHGSVYESLRFEPTLLRGLGDALLGGRLTFRPPWATEMDFNAESYQLPHTVDWATGAAILVSTEAVRSVGEWNEDFFLYSEETDFLRRVRAAGLSVWFEPGARVTHVGAASGSWPELDALRAVNRVRYAELHHGRGYALAARGVVAISSVVRVHCAKGHRRALHYVLHRSRWSELPAAGQGLARSGPRVGDA